MNQGTNLGSQKGRWVILAALVAVLGALLFLLPGGLLQAQQTAETYYHQENSDEPVVTLAANDPEGVTPIYWDILTDATGMQDLPGGIVDDEADDVGPDDVTHGLLFEVEGGVLSFLNTPDYEAMGPVTVDGTPVTVDGTAVTYPNDQEYKVVVQASDGGEMEWVQYFKVTVIVLDQEEAGSVTWTVDPVGEPAAQDLLEFQAAATLAATVEDDDGPDTLTNITWKWYRSASNTGPWTLIDGAGGAAPDGASYIVSDNANDNDVGMYLRAVASYTDNRGSNKEAENISDYPVRPAKVQNNSGPEFNPTSVAREVQEGSADRNVGPPVSATDADGDVLNYTPVTPVTVDSPFDIDQATGQITTNAALLDYETLSADETALGVDEPVPADAWSLITNPDSTISLVYPLVVKATDSAGGETEGTEGTDADDLTVTITLLNVNEAPEWDDDDAVGVVTADNIEGIVERNEGGFAELWNAVVSTYRVDDPEGVNINEGKWSLSGDDAAKFELTGTADNFRTLQFKEEADFEAKADQNRDNIYEVTVVASDGTKRAERSVTVKITDSDELGKITLSPENPVARSAVTATPTDSDGDVINAVWTWYSLTSAETADGTIAGALAGTTNVIVGETSDTYTPTSDDIGQHLVAVAVYMDRTEDEDNTVTPEDPTSIGLDGVRFDNRAESNPSAPVTDVPGNKAPEFREGRAATRYVEEDDAPGDLVARDPETIGAPLAIDDDDLPNDSHTFTLSGADAAYFDIESSAAGGQLKTKEPLNYESKKTYNVVVTVRDGSGESNDTDTINVTVQVKDLDEHPVITGDGNEQHNENDTGTVLTLVANDPEGVTPIHWEFVTEEITADLPGGNEGPDANDIAAGEWEDYASFDIENGVLTFDGEPDFEARVDKTYQAVVKASDGGFTTWVQYFKVTVEVLDLEEEGDVNWVVDGDGDGSNDNDGNPDDQVPNELLEFQPDAILTASVEDPDGPDDIAVDGTTTWQWSRSTSRTGGWTDIPNATTAIYIVSDDANDNDVGHYLRVEARYTDRRGANKEAEKISEHRVRPRKVNANSVPEFAPTEHTRRILENADEGTAVGGPVTATDADGDVLNYTLNEDALDLFNIDQATGQITVAGGLDYEARIADKTALPPTQDHTVGTWALIDNDDGTTSLNYVLEVRATDSAGDETIDRNGDPVADTAHARVTITLLNVNEAPVFDGEVRDQNQNIRGMATDRREDTAPTPSTDRPWNPVVSSYMAMDPEGVVIDGSKWSLSGADAAKFELNDPSPASPGTKVLEFREPADFEAKADQNGDNIYEVTVVASDGSEEAELDVTVKVLDSDEPGEIMFSPDANPVSGSPITAALSDSDGDVINVAWQWYALDAANEELPGNEIKGEKSDTYTPKGDDIGKLLVITAKYMDRTEDEDNIAAAIDDIGVGGVRFANMVTSAATAPVIDDPANAPPVFVEGATAVRYVEEDNLPGETAGRDPVEPISRELAVTDEDPNATHAFTLSGTDAGYFDIEVGANGGGHLMTKARLDYETKDTYTVVVTANDGSGDTNANATITVTIEVKDLDEKPMMFESGLVIRGNDTVSHAENGTDVATYTAAGPMANMARWLRLEGDDARYFTLTNGVLTFKRSPDYEMPRNAPMSDTNTNTYMVTVKATDGTYTVMKEVTVTVTDVDELGRLSGPLTVSHMENSMGAVGTYMASGPMADTAVWTLDDDSHFELEGRGMSTMLKFKSPPDYESPTGGSDDDSNTYMVTVKAEAGGEMEMVEVTVTVSDVNELGTLSGPGSPSHMENSMDAVGTYTLTGGTMDDTATWTLDGADSSQFTLVGTGMSRDLTFSSAPDFENPMGGAADDSNTYMVTVKAEAGGEPAEMVPVTIEVTDVDELGALSGSETASVMEGATDALGTYTLTGGTMDDTATWTLDGADSSQFTLVGTGMSRDLTFSSAPDFENPMGGAADDSNTYMVTVKAEAGGEPAEMVPVTIEVTDVDELGALSGSETASVMEGATDALGTYTLTGGTMDDTATWTLDGADSSQFTLVGTGMSRDLTFSSAPDFENPMGGAADDSNTYMVTVKAEAGGEPAEMVPVTIEVTDVDELGALSGSETASVMEGATDALGTYTLTGGTMDDTATWTLDGADSSQFTLVGTGMSRDLTFSSAPDFENPMGGAADDSNTYMVTVKAEAGGEPAEMVPVTIEVTDVDELGALSGSETASVMEGATDALGTYTLTGGTMDDTATWTLDGADAEYFTIMDGVLKFSSAPDYEMPRGMAMSEDNTNTYMVTVEAEAGGEMAMQEVTVMVTDVVELGMLTADMVSPISYMENGTMTVATYTVSGPMADNATWTKMGDDAEYFTLTDGVLTFSSPPDYEMPRGAAMSDANTNTYEVTVKAEAGGEMAMQEVTVMVTNVVELGMLTADMDSPISYMENGTMTVATYTVSGDDGTTVNWSLDGADGSHFTLDGTDMSRMLKFKSAPDYEMPRGAAMSDTNTNTYMVTVKASAGGVMEMVDVTVMVTNEEEDGTVTLSTMSPAVGSEVTASLTDLDGDVSGTTWQWASADAMDVDFTNIDGADSASYTPVEDDAGMYLQATASYTDGHGTGKMATSEAVMVSADIVGGYDTNTEPGIQIDELLTAIEAHFSGELSIADLLVVIEAYFG